jgi:predicted Zn-dependent protease
MREAIDHGFGVTLTYSHLAKYQHLDGDDVRADSTLREALAIFPNSVFLRVRYGVFLNEIGRPDDGAHQLAIARNIDLKQANGWHMIMTRGSVATMYMAQADPTVAYPADLRPGNAVLQFLDK